MIVPTAHTIFLFLAASFSLVATAATNLAMEVFYTHGISDILNVESERDIKGTLPSQPLHNLKVTSGIGSASLVIKAGSRGNAEVKHTGNAWAVILDPPTPLVLELNNVYPTNIAGSTTFKPAPNPTGSNPAIKENGIFMLVVPVVDDEVFTINPNHLLGALRDLEGNDLENNLIYLKGMTEHYIKNALVALVVGRFVPSPEPVQIPIPVPTPVTATTTTSTTNTVATSGLASMLQDLKSKSTYSLGNTITWNLSSVKASGLGAKSTSLAFLTNNDESSAGVQVGGIEDGPVKLTYAQTGQASVFVLRPSQEGRIVFPEIEGVEELSAGRYFAFESEGPTMVQDINFRLGDLVVVVMPLKKDWKVGMAQLIKLMKVLAVKSDLFDDRSLLIPFLFDTFSANGASDVFLSFSTIVSSNAPVAPPSDLPTISQWPKTNPADSKQDDEDVVEVIRSYKRPRYF